jgi:hypothetical protein|tara:strand:- start:226 stop:378 length:153 start_codon:yes stop_codon:yes gene_type:complete
MVSQKEMNFTKIYLEGNEWFINEILKQAKDELGDSCNVINLNPKFKEEDD